MGAGVVPFPSPHECTPRRSTAVALAPNPIPLGWALMVQGDVAASTGCTTWGSRRVPGVRRYGVGGDLDHDAGDRGGRRCRSGHPTEAGLRGGRDTGRRTLPPKLWGAVYYTPPLPTFLQPVAGAQRGDHTWGQRSALFPGSCIVLSEYLSISAWEWVSHCCQGC